MFVKKNIFDKGVQYIFLGYALYHAPDSYRMWNTETNGVHVTCDII